MPIDYKQYPSNWKTEIRPAILERDNHCCKFCHLPNYCFINKKTREICLPDEDNVTRIILTIAHLDQDKTNNDYENLAALCQKCHLGIDLKHHMENARATREKNKQLQRLF